MAEEIEVQSMKRKRLSREGFTKELTTTVADIVKDSPVPCEKPTSQRTLANGCPLLDGIAWSCMKSKMQSLRNTYIEANKWKQQTGAVLTADGDESSVVDYLNKICPHYEELHAIFGQRTSVNPSCIIESSETTDAVLHCECDESSLATPLQISSPANNDHSVSVPSEDTYQSPEELSVSFLNDSINTRGYKKQRKSMHDMKLQFEREKFNWQKKIEQLELQYQLKIRQMQFDKEERVEKYELDLKYRKKELE